jgi:2-keto-4-pentenoate hydratase/2-oxohepta-3-ene-1,7-dioic acid hydratase in catechol pathway
VVGPHDDVPVSPGCERFDYEPEVCAVIGKPAADVALDRAEEHIAGYMLFCDWSAGSVDGRDGAARRDRALPQP